MLYSLSHSSAGDDLPPKTGGREMPITLANIYALALVAVVFAAYGNIYAGLQYAAIAAFGFF